MAQVAANDLFAPHPLLPNGGVNPPYAPPYPHEWSADCHRVDIVAEVDTDYLDELLSVTPFTRAGGRVIFRYAAMRQHTLALEAGGFVETMVVAPVLYRGLRTYTYVYHYTDNEIANTAGRELLGYSKKHANTTFNQDDSTITGETSLRTGEWFTRYSFQFDSAAPVASAVPGEVHQGSVHVRRLPYPDRLGDAYADVVYRRYRLADGRQDPGTATLELGKLDREPLHLLRPEVVGACYVHAAFGGSLETEDRGILEVLTTPKIRPVEDIETAINTAH